MYTVPDGRYREIETEMLAGQSDFRRRFSPMREGRSKGDPPVHRKGVCADAREAVHERTRITAAIFGRTTASFLPSPEPQREVEHQREDQRDDE